MTVGKARPARIAIAGLAVAAIAGVGASVANGSGKVNFVAYAVLAALATATWLTARRTASRGIAALAIALCGFGAIDEITQPFFRRHADPLDWVYDCIGIAIGIAAVVSVVALARRFTRAQ